MPFDFDAGILDVPDIAPVDRSVVAADGDRVTSSGTEGATVDHRPVADNGERHAVARERAILQERTRADDVDTGVRVVSELAAADGEATRQAEDTHAFGRAAPLRSPV